MLWAPFLLAFAVACIATPFAIWIAPKIGAMDVPKDDRRVHNKPIPRFGGIAIFALSLIHIFSVKSTVQLAVSILQVHRKCRTAHMIPFYISIIPVSYTHLDVYKRQCQTCTKS